MFKSRLCVRLVEQDRWARQQAAQNTSDIWAAIGAVLTQFDGLLAGYNARVGAALAVLGAGNAAGSGLAGATDAGRDSLGASARRRHLAAVQEEEAAERLGFGARPVPPPLTRADLLMVSAVGADPES